MDNQVMELFTSVVSQMQTSTLIDFIDRKKVLAEFDYIQELLDLVELDPAVLGDIDRFSVYKAVERVDPGKAQILVNMPDGMNWLEGNIDAVRAVYIKRQTQRNTIAEQGPV